MSYDTDNPISKKEYTVSYKMLALGLQSIYLYFLYMRGFIYNFLLCKVYLTSDLKLTYLLKPEMPSPYLIKRNINEHNCQLYEYFMFGLSFLKMYITVHDA